MQQINTQKVKKGTLCINKYIINIELNYNYSREFNLYSIMYDLK